MSQSHRPTKDLDLLGHGSSELADVAEAVRQVCLVEAEDELVFGLDSIKAERIRKDAEYQGVRIRLSAELAAAQIPMQNDVGFGDVITPDAQVTGVPSLLDMEAPKVLVYPRETTIAEKLHAMVILDIGNTRMKDFYDLWFLSQNWPFQMLAIADAIRATFERRRTPLPVRTPFGLTPAFYMDKQKSLQWTAFLKRLRLSGATPRLPEVGEAIWRFIERPLRKHVNKRELKEDGQWRAAGPSSEVSAKPATLLLVG